MKTLKKTAAVLLATAAVLAAIFLAGRYGWRLGGFSACQDAGITSVEVREDAVRIAGFYPGSFPAGFCGFHSEEKDGALYVGFCFSAVFGLFEPGEFDIEIPVQSKISEVILKTRTSEFCVWNALTGLAFRPERGGVYVKLERNDVYSVSMSYQGFSGGVCHSDYTAMDSGECCFMDNDILSAARESATPISFAIAVRDEGGNEIASGQFVFDAGRETMYLAVSADGGIREIADDEA